MSQNRIYVWLFLFLGSVWSLTAQQMEETDSAAVPDTTLPQTAVAVKPSQLEGGITAIAQAGSEHHFFAAGKNGFLIRCSYPQLEAETYQVSDLAVKLIAVNPKTQYIALYETDDFSIHKISLWNWETKTQLYAKRFSSTVLSLSWSAQGTYLFIGTASVEGITVLDARGNAVNVYAQPPGIVLLAATGPSEKSIVTYGETGRLVYADIAKKRILTQYETEDRLEKPELIKNYTHIVGYKNGAVTVIQAASGKILQTYPSESALFAGTLADTAPVWIEQHKNKREWYLRNGEEPPRAFTLPAQTRITAARRLQDDIIIGTESGLLYSVQYREAEQVSVKELSTVAGEKAVDMCIKDSHVYILTEKALYEINEPHTKPQHYADIPPKTDRCTAFRNGFLLWSSYSARTPLYYLEKNSAPHILYKPREVIASLSVYDGNIAIVHAFSGAVVLNGTTGEKQFEYKAAGLQEAVQLDNTFLLVSKSAADSIQKPLFLINMDTSETIFLPLTGSLIFSLQCDHENRREVSCFRLETGARTKTELLVITIDTTHPLKTHARTLLSYKDEDLQAFITKHSPYLVTNIGKEQLVLLDTSRKQIRKLARTSALPRKAVIQGRYIISVNHGGSVSRYSLDTLKPIEVFRIS